MPITPSRQPCRQTLPCCRLPTPRLIAVAAWGLHRPALGQGGAWRRPSSCRSARLLLFSPPHPFLIPTPHGNRDPVIDTKCMPTLWLCYQSKYGPVLCMSSWFVLFSWPLTSSFRSSSGWSHPAHIPCSLIYSFYQSPEPTQHPPPPQQRKDISWVFIYSRLIMDI